MTPPVGGSAARSVERRLLSPEGGRANAGRGPHPPNAAAKTQRGAHRHSTTLTTKASMAADPLGAARGPATNAGGAAGHGGGLRATRISSARM